MVNRIETGEENVCTEIPSGKISVESLASWQRMYVRKEYVVVVVIVVLQYRPTMFGGGVAQLVEPTSASRSNGFLLLLFCNIVLPCYVMDSMGDRSWVTGVAQSTKKSQKKFHWLKMTIEDRFSKTR